MKRILAMLLCLTCLLGVLASCRGNQTADPTETTTGAPDAPAGETVTTTVPMAQYTIVYPKKASKTLKETANRLAESMNAKHQMEGIEIKAVNDDNVSATGYEILIGKTNRPYSQAYYMEGLKSEFAVKNAKKAIVLAGYSDVMTDKAVQYFEENYIATSTDGKMASVTDYTCTLDKTFDLTEANAANTKVVYEAGLSSVADSVITAIKTATGLTLTKEEAEDYTYNKKTTEILIGNFGVKALMDIESSLWLKSYVVASRDNKIILSATDKDQYEPAVAELQTLLTEHKLQDTKGVYLHADNLSRTVADDALANVVSVSQAPTNVYPAGDGAYVAIYEGVNESTRNGKFFTEYTEALEAAGYTKYTATDFNGDGSLEKNKFATYVNDQVVIDVAFHTIGHLGCETLEEIESGKTAEDYPVWWESFSGGIMFVTLTPKSSGMTLPSQQAPAYTPVDEIEYPTLLTSIGCGDFHANEASNCYVVRLADGTFIIHDSSYGGGLGNITTADAIYDVLNEQAPDPNNIVISAWITSHPHADHMDGLLKFANKYASDPKITIKQFVHNFADSTISTAAENSNAIAVRMAAKKFPNAQVVKPSTGNVLYYANVKFNVLYTHVDHLAVNKGQRYDGNSSTMVMQMVTSDGVSVLFGGDHSAAEWNHGTGSSRVPCTWGALRKWYGSFIESYVFTYMHHGLGGGTDWETNATIKPKIILWPCTWGKINGANLHSSGHSIYMTRKVKGGSAFTRDATTLQGNGQGFEEGKLHSTPNYMGVYGWFVADNNVHVVKLKNNDVTVTTYDTIEAYSSAFAARKNS